MYSLPDVTPDGCFRAQNQRPKAVPEEKFSLKKLERKRSKTKNKKQQYDRELDIDKFCSPRTSENKDVVKRSPQDTSSDKSENLTAYEIAKKLAAEHTFATENGHLYLYKPADGYFRLLGDSLSVCRSLKNRLPEQIRLSLTRYCISEIENNLVSYKEFAIPLKLNTSEQERFVNFSNGVLDLQDMRLLKHSPKYQFTSVIDSAFIEGKGKLPKPAKLFFNRICGSDEMILRQLRCLLGLALSNIRSAKIAFFVIGPANCGKSTLLALIQDLVGEENCSALSLRDLTKTFRLARAFGKKLNIVAELPQEELQDIDTIKSILGNKTDKLTAEVKFKDPFEFTPNFLSIFGGNTMPRIPAGQDPDEALRKRMYIINLPQSIPKSEQNPHVLEEMYQCRDEIVRWAIDGAVDYLENGLPYNDVKYDDIVEYGASNMFEEFLRTCCDLVPDVWTSSADISIHYHQYCEAMGVDMKCRASASRISIILKQCEGVEKSAKMNSKERHGWGYWGIRLRNAENQNV